MKKPLLFLLLCFNSCKKDLEIINYIPYNVPDTNCIDTTLIPNINIPNSYDLTPYLTRPDFLTTTCYKVVPSQGYIPWISNTSVDSFEGRYGIALMNYVDTSQWWRWTKYAFVREVVTFEIKLNSQDTHTLVHSRYQKINRDTLVSDYFRLTSDGDVIDASWDLDTTYRSYVKLNCINWDTKEIEGIYDLHFMLTSQSTRPNVKYSPKAFFKCGSFKARF